MFLSCEVILSALATQAVLGLLGLGLFIDILKFDVQFDVLYK